MNLIKEDIRKLPFEILIDQKTISERVAELGSEITADYTGKKLVLLGVLKGCIVFMTDLMREIDLLLEIEFISASSYKTGTKQDSNMTISPVSTLSLAGKHVLIVEGIVDSGDTSVAIIEEIEKMEPASLEMVTLLDKPTSHRNKLDIKYKGFTIGNKFVIGYGLDNTQLYRNLPFIGKVAD